MSELKSMCCGAGVIRQGRFTPYAYDMCKKCGKPCEIGGNDPLITPTDSHECDFCGTKTDGKLILRDTLIRKKDGSDIVLCDNCMRNYAAGDYDKIKLKVPAGPEVGKAPTGGVVHTTAHLNGVEASVPAECPGRDASHPDWPESKEEYGAAGGQAPADEEIIFKAEQMAMADYCVADIVKFAIAESRQATASAIFKAIETEGVIFNLDGHKMWSSKLYEKVKKKFGVG